MILDRCAVRSYGSGFGVRASPGCQSSPTASPWLLPPVPVSLLPGSTPVAALPLWSPCTARRPTCAFLVIRPLTGTLIWVAKRCPCVCFPYPLCPEPSPVKEADKNNSYRVSSERRGKHRPRNLSALPSGDLKGNCGEQESATHTHTQHTLF